MLAKLVAAEGHRLPYNTVEARVLTAGVPSHSLAVILPAVLRLGLLKIVVQILDGHATFDHEIPKVLDSHPILSSDRALSGEETCPYPVLDRIAGHETVTGHFAC